MAVEFARGLMISEVIGVEALERALFVAVSNDSPLELALLDTNALSVERLEHELARADAPVLHDVVADVDLLDRLPAGLCSRLLAAPLRYDERSNTVDLAVVNVFDTHAAEEIAYHLQANVVAVRATLAQVEAALQDRPSYAELVASRPPRRRVTLGAPVMRHETPPPDAVLSRRTPAWVAADAADESDEGENPSDIPIPLTRRRTTFAPSTEGPLSGDDTLATLTYSRLGGGLSLPSAELVERTSSLPASPGPGSYAAVGAAEEGLRIDSLPAAAVEVAPSRGERSSSVPTRREPELPVSPETVRRADLPPRPDPGDPTSARNLLALAPAILLRGGPETVRNVAPRPPPVSDARAPSERPPEPRRSAPPISVKAPSIAPPPAPGARASVRPRAPGQSLPPEATKVLASLKTAPDRDAVLGYALAGARVVARRVALFVARRGAYVGWSCSPEFGDEVAFAALQIPQEAQTVLSWASQEGTYLGPLDPSAHGPLIAVMGTASRDVTAVPIRMNGKTAVVILADQLGDTMIATKRLEEIAGTAGEALLRIVRTGKK